MNTFETEQIARLIERFVAIRETAKVVGVGGGGKTRVSALEEVVNSFSDIVKNAIEKEIK